MEKLLDNYNSQKMTAKAATTIHCSNKFADWISAEDTFLCLAIKKKACYKYFMHLGQNKACPEVFWHEEVEGWVSG